SSQRRSPGGSGRYVMSTEKDEPTEVPHGEEAPAPPELVARRRFRARVSVGLGGCMGLAVGAPLAGFVVAPLFGKVPFEWRTVGKVKDFEVGRTVAVIFIDASPLPW